MKPVAGDCPRCGGTLLRTQGEDVSCLACGYVPLVEVPARPDAQALHTDNVVDRAMRKRLVAERPRPEPRPTMTLDELAEWEAQMTGGSA